MEPIDPSEIPGRFVNFAEDQPEYFPLPARAHADYVHTRWRLTLRERLAVLFGRCIDIRIRTFGAPLQTLLPTVQGSIPAWRCYESRLRGQRH